MRGVKEIDVDLVKSLFNYNPKTGIFTRKTTMGGKRAGSRAGRFMKDGYRTIRIYRKMYYEHRLAWALVYGDNLDMDIDHIDGDKANNKICNLRLATPSQNLTNSGVRKDSLTGRKGVIYAKSTGKYQARFTFNKKHYHLGSFDCKEKAHRAYIEAVKEIAGEEWLRCDSKKSAETGANP